MMFVVMFVYLLSPYLVFLFSLRTWSCPHVFLPVTSLKHMCLSPSRHCYLTSCLILIVSCSPCVVFRFASPVSSVRFVSAVFFPPSLPSVYLCPQSPSDPCCIVRSLCGFIFSATSMFPCFVVSIS